MPPTPNPFHSGPYLSLRQIGRLAAASVQIATALVTLGVGAVTLGPVVYRMLYGAVEAARHMDATISAVTSEVDSAVDAVGDAAGDALDWAFPPRKSATDQADPVSDQAARIERSLEQRKAIAARMALSTYLVQTPDGGHGTGVRISDTEIITARHVTDGNDLFFVSGIMGGVALATELYDGGAARDYAVLAIPAATPGAISPLDCREPIPGEPVTHIGNPGKTRFGFQTGIVSPFDSYPDDGSLEIELIMTVNPGSSGGPVFDADGDVLGVVTASLNTPEGVPGAFSMALPSSVLCVVMGIK